MTLHPTFRFCLIIIVLGCLVLPAGVAAAGAEAPGVADASSLGQLQPLICALAWLLPVGVTLVAAGISHPSQVRQIANSLPLALVAALGGYWLCGYAFQFGGVGLISDDPDLAWLVAEWSPLDLRLGHGWGLLGLRGFAVDPSAIGKGLDLFVSQLALVVTATLIPLIALNGRAPRLPTLFLALLVSCMCYPLMGNWVRGGGWLSHLGATLGLGHGFVDYGLSSVHLVGGGAALAGLIALKSVGGDDGEGKSETGESEPLELPQAFLPLNVLAGAFLALVGWLAVIFSQPLVPSPQSPAMATLNVLLAVGGSAVGTLFYGWLARGEPDPALTGRGILAALVAIAAGLPFVPFWAAALVGGLCGLLLAPTMYLVEQVLRLDDRGAVVSVHCASAFWGLLAIGLFADGREGLGWNAFSPPATSGGFAHGVIGCLATPGLRDLGQLYAQLIGLGALLLLAGLLPWTMLAFAARAYALPPTMRQRARARAAQLRQERAAREALRRQGRHLELWQALHIAYLRNTAVPYRLLARRARASRQNPGAGGIHPVRRRMHRTVGTRRLRTLR